MARRPHSNAFPGTSTRNIRRRIISEWIIIIQENVKEQAVKWAICSCHLPLVVAVQELCFSLFISTRSFEIFLIREMICWLREVASFTARFQDDSWRFLWRKKPCWMILTKIFSIFNGDQQLVMGRWLWEDGMMFCRIGSSICFSKVLLTELCRHPTSRSFQPC